MTIASYPNAQFSWGTDRVDGITVDWANDVNSLAAEVVAVEGAVGDNPQNEPYLPADSTGFNAAGPNFSSASQRMSAITNGTMTPVVSLSFDELYIPNTFSCGPGTQYGFWNNWDRRYDPWNCYNGVDITCPASGWWIVSSGQWWDWYSTGYHRHSFWCGGDFYRHDFWDWDFDGNRYGGYWWTNDYVQRPTFTSFTWQGVILAGQRMQILSENGTPHTPHRTYNGDFKATWIRSVPPGTPAG
jgi:hypothetical protein